MRVLRRGFLVLAAGLAAALAAAGWAQARAPRVEVVVTLGAPPLAQAFAESRTLTAAAKRRLSLRAPSSVSYLRSLAAAQRTLAARIVQSIPDAHVRWHYQVVANGLAVVLADAQRRRLASIPGVVKVYPSVRYHSLLAGTTTVIGANQLWGADFSTAGNGIKIGVLDEGVDQSHPFFSPSGFTMPAGFPKGDRAFTTAKVIAARAFPPPSPAWRYARLPFDPKLSEHGTHVAGIAAGDYGLTAPGVSGPASGIAPRAYIGNYKVLTVPTPGFGLDGNSPEIVAGIEAAVRDGMDVINLSLGEPEMEPKRDLVVAAINAAADAGVVPAIAAGNDYEEFGRGSLSSPGSAQKAITAAAASENRVIGSFSSSGPTPISLQLKPDVTAPGVNVVSSVPRREGTWASFNGTSMASPHVAGAAALLRQRHPTWTVAQIKSALVLTGTPVFTDTSRLNEAPTTREGGGLLDLPLADRVPLFAAPTNAAFGFLGPGTNASRTIDLTDAGAGAGAWTVGLAPQSTLPGVTVTVPPTVTVPGQLPVVAAATTAASEGDLTGFVTLSRGSDRLRIPYWLHVATPRLAAEPRRALSRPGIYRGNTAAGVARVDAYRYPDDPSPLGIPAALAGPEQVFRVRITGSPANFGVVVLSRGRGVRVEPRVVYAGDENRLTGYPALPLDINPYRATYGRRVPVAGAILPSPGSYDIVFDTRSRETAGPFSFRFWIGDTTPPSVGIVSKSVARGGRLGVRVRDGGSGVDPTSLVATVDGKGRTLSYSSGSGLGAVSIAGLRPGRHTLVLGVSDYQETKNMEDVPRILPNTRVFRGVFRVR